MNEAILDGKIQIIESKLKYKRYVALLTQSGIDLPSATVLENTLGQEVDLSIVASPSFVESIKSIGFSSSSPIFTGSVWSPIVMYRNNQDAAVEARLWKIHDYQVVLQCIDVANWGNVFLDTSNFTIEIRVYP